MVKGIARAPIFVKQGLKVVSCSTGCNRYGFFVQVSEESCTSPNTMSVSDRRNPSYEAECPICAEPFVEARQLPCEHVYCLECLERWVSDELDQPAPLTCPTCREQFQLPENGVQELPAPVSRELDFDDEDLEIGSFEMVPVAWTLDNQTTSGGEEAEPSADAQTGDYHNAGDVTDDDVINRNVRVISTGGDEDTPTGSVQLVLDNEVRMNSPEDRHDNDQGDRLWFLNRFWLG